MPETAVESLEAWDTRAEPAAFRPRVTVVTAILSVADGKLACLLCRAPNGAWTLPRSAPQGDESLEAAARRTVVEQAGREDAYVEQLYTWGDPPRGEPERLLEVGYLALTTRASDPPAVRSALAHWMPLSQADEVAPEHSRILQYAHHRLRHKLGYSNVAWSLLPAEFSFSDLQEVYEVVLGRTLDKRNFRKWVLGNGLLEATPHERREGAHRPARLYRFTTREVRLLE